MAGPLTGAQGFEPCWTRGGFTYQDCCVGLPNPSCFDAVFTEERCCMDADNDPECWRFARRHISSALRLVEAQAASGPEALQLQAQALRRYSEDDGLLYAFCCNGFHNEYCWGPAVPEALLSDPDAWEGARA
ncbi:unnamed protein product [Effrenium voratum]|uniref:Uncharacterized protein n=1 Tax=Effrenium voratum TaxID=2562239 RepID=A0AA36JE70_9DINO|nr:unnamed protein product [Effrenium voratum]